MLQQAQGLGLQELYAIIRASLLAPPDPAIPFEVEATNLLDKGMLPWWIEKMLQNHVPESDPLILPAFSPEFGYFLNGEVVARMQQFALTKILTKVQAQILEGKHSLLERLLLGKRLAYMVPVIEAAEQAGHAEWVEDFKQVWEDNQRLYNACLASSGSELSAPLVQELEEKLQKGHIGIMTCFYLSPNWPMPSRHCASVYPSMQEKETLEQGLRNDESQTKIRLATEVIRGLVGDQLSLGDYVQALRPFWEEALQAGRPIILPYLVGGHFTLSVLCKHGETLWHFYQDSCAVPPELPHGKQYLAQLHSGFGPELTLDSWANLARCKQQYNGHDCFLHVGLNAVAIMQVIEGLKHKGGGIDQDALQELASRAFEPTRLLATKRYPVHMLCLRRALVQLVRSKNHEVWGAECFPGEEEADTEKARKWLEPAGWTQEASSAKPREKRAVWL